MFSFEPMTVEHPEDLLVRPAMQRAVERARSRRRRRYGSAYDEPTARIAFVEQFCSWSAWSRNRISSARARIGLAAYFGSVAFHSMFMKFSMYLRSLSGYTYGRPKRAGRRRRQRRHLRDEPDDLTYAVFGVVNVLRFRINRG